MYAQRAQAADLFAILCPFALDANRQFLCANSHSCMGKYKCLVEAGLRPCRKEFAVQPLSLSVSAVLGGNQPMPPARF